MELLGVIKTKLNNYKNPLLFSGTLAYFTRREILYPVIGFLIVFLLDTILGSLATIKNGGKDKKPFSSESFAKKTAKKMLNYLIVWTSFWGLGMVSHSLPEVWGLSEIVPAITIAMGILITIFCEIISIEENLTALGFDPYPMRIVKAVGKRIFEGLGIYLPEREEKEEWIKEDDGR
ncbi:MAG: hypothetical protein DDT23_01265 [candidate division WS2 bacterium]|nr:hypothetical protein [Candidatus Lithacetigena glycinireducens]